jgi:hypothetical protein
MKFKLQHKDERRGQTEELLHDSKVFCTLFVGGKGFAKGYHTGQDPTFKILAFLNPAISVSSWTVLFLIEGNSFSILMCQLVTSVCCLLWILVYYATMMCYHDDPLQ